MPQFDLANASLSTAGLTKIKTAEKYIPFVYDDGYPFISTTGVSYSDNDPKPPSASTNYISDFYGRIPYNPDFHKQIRGTLTVGYGTTLDGRPGKDTLYNQVYNDGISIGGSTYKFPIEFLEANATNSTGGFFKNESGSQVTNAPIALKYTGNDSSNTTKVMNATLASTLLSDKIATYVAKVKSVFNGSEDAFPYDATLAQQHFDMMVAICYHQGTVGFEHSFFVNRYKLVTGSNVTGVANLTAYNDAAYSLMWLAAVGHEGTYYWVKPQIDRRNNDINELVGTAASRTFPTGINPILKPDWYQGAEIPVEYFENQKNIDLGLDGSIGARNSTSRTIVSNEQQNFVTPAVDFHTGALSAIRAAGITTDFADYYTGNRSIYSSEPGSADFYKNDPLYQKYYSKFWQPNEKFYHGADVVASQRTATNHGAVFAANPDGQTPSFILGLNEDGSGISRVYLRSSLSQSTISSGTDTTIWDIADGKTMGSINYGQWNHFAITRSGNIFRTFKNGTKQNEWTSAKAITRSTRDGTLAFSIGRSQGADYFKGFIDDLRVTKGSALYTANFTAPSAALTTTSTTGLYNGDHYVESVYSAINKVSEQLGTEYRVNTDGTLDAGLKTVLFEGHGTNEPPAIIVRDSSGEDPAISGLTPEQITAQFDAEDYVSGVELLTQVEGSSQTADHAEAFDSDIPYRDLFGAKLERIQFVSESDIPNIQRQDRAQAYLNELKKVKKTLSLSLEEYEIQGDFNVGDMIYVYDPEIRFEDTEAKKIEDGRTSLYEVAYRGQIINPEKIRITGITWPVKSGYGVYLRKVASTAPYRVEYIDLTDYVQWETGNTQLDIGDLAKRIGEDMRFSSIATGVVSGTRQTSVRSPKHPDTGVEGDLKLTSATVQDDLGRDNAIIFVQWQEPTYDNGSPVQNGLQYQIEWKPSNTTGDYQSSFVNWSSSNDFTIEGLQLNTTYEVRVIPILTNANSGTAATGSVTTALDTNAPSKPATASTIAAGALRVQIIHNLARVKDDAGNVIGSPTNFTLQRDTHHLNVYASTSSGFSLANATLKAQHKVGELNVGSSSIKLQIPVVGEIQMPNGSTHYFRFTAVDNAGNESEPSDEQSSNGNLVATANISDAAISSAKIANLAVTDAKIDTLTAGKITAGTIAGQAITVGTNTSDSSIIKSSNYSSGSAGWAIKSDGTIEANTGNFRGNITGASGTFSGALSAATGSFDGSISGASGTFTGDLSGSNISGGTIDIGGSDSTSFHVDTNGNMFLGAATLGSAPFKVTNDGVLTATSVSASNVFVSGVAITPTTTTSAVVMNADSSVDANLTTGSSGVIRTSSGSNRIQLSGSGSASTYIDFIKSSSTTGRIVANADEFLINAYNSGDVLTLRSEIAGTGTTNLEQGTLNIKASTDIVTTVGTSIDFGGNIGKGASGSVLTSNANGMSWQATSGHSHGNLTFPNAGTLVTNQNVSTAHGTHADNNYLTNNNHSHGNTMTPNNHNHNFGNDITGFSGNNHNHTAYLSIDHVMNNNNPHGLNTHTGSNSAHGINSTIASALLAHRIDYSHSDERLKENISETNLGLDFINRLQPRDFTWKSNYLDYMWDDDENAQAQKLKDLQSNSQQGFIAQEVKDAVYQETGSNTSFGGLTLGDVSDFEKTTTSNADDFGRVDYTQFIAPLVKAVQQLSSKIDVMQARIDELEG